MSYRFTGASDNVKNYICLDGTTTEGKCTSDDDLYRIIAIEMKKV